MEALDILHPIRILAQPDADITTVIHSFFVLAYDPTKMCIDVLARHPLNRKNIDQAEDGLKQFLIDPQVLSNSEELCVSHVMTNHDGRLFLFARCYNQKMIAFVSALPILSFFRSLLKQLEVSPIESILPTIYTFSEFPVLPLPFVNYRFQFGESDSVISFGGLQYVEETDLDVIAMTVLTPIMMVKAWEAIILDRSILVVSKDTSLLLPCCEFLRKLISPMSFSGTFIPIMPSIELLEATGTFLMGADLNMLASSDAPLSGIVILDLDRRMIIHTPIITGQGLPEEPYLAAPPCLLQNMLKRITAKQQEPLAKWFQRSFNEASSIEDLRSNSSCSKRYTEVLKFFSFINTSLLSAQCCTISGFYRTIKPESSFIHHVLGIQAAPNDDLSKLGYSEDCGFIVGYMQFWKDTEAEEAIHRTIFCWSELDNSTLAVYEFADDLPLLLIPIEEIGAVASCSMEPEGHVFEITLKSQQVFRFTSNDQPSRQCWLNAIEQKLANTNKNAQSPALANLQQIRTQDFADFYNLANPAANNTTANGNNVESFSLRTLGFQTFAREIDTTISLHYQEFRNLVRRTQNCLFLNTETQSAKYETLFTKRRESLVNFLSPKHSFEVKMRRYISNIHRIGDMLMQIKKDVDNNRVDDEPSTAEEPLSPTVQAKLQRTMTEPGQDPNPAAVEADSKKGIFTRLFSSSKKKTRDSLNANPSPSIGGSSVDENNRASTLDLEKEAHEKVMILTMHKLLHVVLAYNRSLSEINNHVVDNRYKILQKLITEAKQKVLFLNFNMQDLIQSELALGSEIAQKYHRNNLSAKSPFRKQYPQFNHLNTNDSNLFELLCEALVPPALVFKQPIMSRTTSYAAPGHAGDRTSTTVSEKILQTSNDIAEDGSRSPKDSKIQFNVPSREGSFSIVSRVSGIDPSNQSMNPNESSKLDNHSNHTTNDDDSPPNESDFPEIKVDGVEINVDVDDDAEELDVNDFLVENLETEYENAINAMHKEIKHHVLSFLYAEEKRKTEEDSIYLAVITTLIGYVLHNTEDYSKALIYYSRYNLINQSRIAQCLLKLFVKRTALPDFYEKFNEPRFIVEGFMLSSTIGMHSYRLILELVHNELKTSAERRDHLPISDPSIALTSFRAFFRSGQQQGKKTNKPAAAALRADFEWIEPANKSEVLNEAFICTKLTSEATACEMSSQLLIRLREILKTYASSPQGEKYAKKIAANVLRLKISPQTLQDLQNLSAYKKFELESCQLQKIDMNFLNTNERLFVFTNAYNMLTIHSIISRGSPGNTLLERTSFMRSAKYNIGGHIFSLIDIEHGILRNSSTKPMLLGPLSFDMSFSERDPRRKFALEVPKPNVSFCLFSASASSPPLCVLTDVAHVDKEMSRYAKQYFLDSVKFDYNEKAIYLPALVKVYWADFGSKQNDVLRYIAQTAGSQFAAKTKEYLASIGGSSAKTHFATLDWTPVFIINDS